MKLLETTCVGPLTVKTTFIKYTTMSTQNSDDAMFSSILKSMGITSYDRLVVTALNEYARRYGGALLSDAQDYAEHAGRMVSDNMVVAHKTPFNCALAFVPLIRKLPLNTPEGD